MIASRWLDGPLAYDGSQLSSHWILRQTGIVGDAMVGFRGPCAVRDEEMADLEDLLAGERIAGDDMVHLLWESFDDDGLLLAVHRQRLLSAQGMEVMLGMSPTAVAGGDDGAGAGGLHRRGDDLYLGPGKLSISIATRSAVSSLIHFAVNCTNAGTPVQTASLEDLAIEPESFARALMARAVAEQASIAAARAQVRAKGQAAPTTPPGGDRRG